MFRLLASGINYADEVWFLQVVHRFLAGDVLFEQIRYGMLPLAPDIAAVVMSIVGVELFVIKAIAAVALGGSAALLVSTLERFHVGTSGRIAGGLLFAGLGIPVTASVYNIVSIAFTMATLRLLIAWYDRASTGKGTNLEAWGIGVLSGLAFATKYTIGAALVASVAVFALLVAILRHVRPDIVTASALRSGAGFLGVVVAVAAPVWVTGGWRQLVVQVFDKGPFVAFARYPYAGGSEVLWRFILHWQGSARLILALLIPLAFIAISVRLVRDRADLRLAIPGLGAVIGLAMVFPRADLVHLSYAAPLYVMALVIGSDLRECPRRLRQAVGWGAAGVAAMLVILFAVQGVRSFREKSLVGSTHFRGMMESSARWNEVQEEAAQLAAAVGNEPVMVVSPRAGFFYLTAGLANPTRYDYPLVSQLGSLGEAEIIDRIESGSISRVCLDHHWPRKLAPTALIEWVETHMLLIEELEACDLYAAS